MSIAAAPIGTHTSTSSAAETERNRERSVPMAAASGSCAANSDRRSVPEAKANRNLGARSATSATPNDADSESVISLAKRARLVENKETKTVLRKGEVFVSNLRFSLRRLANKWAAYQCDLSNHRKAGLTSGLDDVKYDLQQLMDLREKCCELEDLEAAEERIEALDIEISSAREEYEDLRERILPLYEENRADGGSVASVAST